jgi:SAM-dependent methyltransferase
MKLRALFWLRCPSCHSPFTGQELRIGADLHGQPEAAEGTLACNGCLMTFRIEEGVPRLITPSSLPPVTRRTGKSFGFLWSRSSPRATGAALHPYHFERMASSVGVDAPQGLVLDAGCGEGIDLVNQARQPGVEILGVELSEGGCQASLTRSRGEANAHVIQADLTHLPFAEGLFDFVYSYGVLHHLAMPEAGLSELLRVLRPGGRCLIYLYEDLGERPRLLRWLLRAANSGRALTTRLPAPALFLACQAASPVIFLLFALPYRLLRQVPFLQGLAEQIPFRHAPGPFGLAGDLYDRFSAPVERRYSRSGAQAFLQQAGAEGVAVGYARGWVVTGVKPVQVAACAG